MAKCECITFQWKNKCQHTNTHTHTSRAERGDLTAYSATFAEIERCSIVALRIFRTTSTYVLLFFFYFLSNLFSLLTCNVLTKDELTTATPAMATAAAAREH